MENIRRDSGNSGSRESAREKWLVRPKTRMNTEVEMQIIKEAKMQYMAAARRLELIIDREYGIHIPHNKIHQCYLRVHLYNAIRPPRENRLE